MRWKGVLAALVMVRLLGAAGVVVRFDPSLPEVGPFPTDSLTVADAGQLTGVRVNLPLRDPETSLLNQLDGFNVQPRLRVRFSGAVNPETIRAGVYLVRLTGEGGEQTRINQVVWDPGTNTAYGEADRVLAAGTRYGLVVTSAVRDRAGDAVGPDPAFLACLAGGDRYCARLREVVEVVTAPILPRARAIRARVVAASVFTTLSATSWLERARAVAQTSALGVERGSPRAAVELSDILVLTLRLQERETPLEFSDTTIPLPAVLLAGVGKVAFGSFRSPYFLDGRQMIPATPTAGEVRLPAATSEVLFHAFLPSGPRPATGYPVVVFGHGLNDSQWGAPTLVASTLARAGFATVAINAMGHGSGPRSVLRLALTNGTTLEFPAGGRSVDRNGDGAIESAEGCLVAEPAPTGLRDCLRQTVLDLMQLVRVIRAGVDLDGDGAVDLDRDRIYYAGQSLGALYGTVLVGLEPGFRAAVLNVGGGTVMDIARWSPDFRGFPRDFLAGRTPPLLNRGRDYDESYVLRNQPAKVVETPGAIEIQNLFETVEWLQVGGDPLAYARQGKAPVLWQFARGDRTVPNPQTSALIRAAGGRPMVQLYRHDVARAVYSDLGSNPHAYLVDVRSAAGAAIALAVQGQIAEFFQANGTLVPAVNSFQLRILFGGRSLFESPEGLPEDLGF